SRLNPQLEKDRSRLETSLSNRGIKLGSDQYDRALTENDRQTTDARMSAILGAGDEQNRLASLSQQQFQNRQQLLDALDRRRAGGLQESLALRNQPINEITALLSGSQV